MKVYLSSFVIYFVVLIGVAPISFADDLDSELIKFVSFENANAKGGCDKTHVCVSKNIWLNGNGGHEKYIFYPHEIISMNANMRRIESDTNGSTVKFYLSGGHEISKDKIQIVASKYGDYYLKTQEFYAPSGLGTYNIAVCTYDGNRERDCSVEVVFRVTENGAEMKMSAAKIRAAEQALKEQQELAEAKNRVTEHEAKERKEREDEKARAAQKIAKEKKEKEEEKERAAKKAAKEKKKKAEEKARAEKDTKKKKH